MEIADDKVIAEIKESIALIRAELDKLESRLTAVQEPAPEPETVPDIDDEEPFDIMLEEPVVEEPAADEPEPLVLTEPEPEPMPEPEPVPVPDPEPEPEPEPEPIPEPEPEPEPRRKVFFESVMPDTMPWKRDIPGPQVQNILSAISLNDRVLFINTLFGGDPLKFQDTIKTFNQCESLAEVEHYIVDNFPKWNMSSDVIYRFMMAVRRKLS